MLSNKKHPREYDECDQASVLDRSGKRIKLDSLLENLKIDDSAADKSEELTPFQETKSNNDKTTSKANSYVVNSSLKLRPYSIYKKSSSSVFSSIASSSGSSPELSPYITERLYSHFKNVYQSKCALIRWYRPYYLIAYHFQRWVTRLFNRFIRKYNTMHPDKNLSALYVHGRLMEMIKSSKSSINYKEYISILLHENKIEQKALKTRRAQTEAKLSAESEGTNGAVGYNYWDKRAKDKDCDMADSTSVVTESDDSEPKILEILDQFNDDDIAMNEADSVDGDPEESMEVETLPPESNVLESNYGTYYQDYLKTNI
ncbi:Piso0_005117 [Millerozyma farinosa CBS 7064]|uniref:Piso0_005117 protein n=1 Tax=Pichia sorbitophila (strain ATCC MYA-4447 / BCRC 22081 / CBS 7064 / NBRC 10061 / NRRL Y-12695) TaxID=559304 RepID=G8Y498_PICSO|nr:Piso0_005117 [Millerozyma farinosa CBS 7064]